MRIRFGECVLDTGRHELSRVGLPVPLSPKAFRLLEVLAERRPHVVSKGEIRDLIWPDTVAGGTTVARLVNEVRSAIGDAALPSVIRTVPRVGYAFSAPALDLTGAAAGAPAESARRYALQWGRRQVALAAGENVIGRSASAVLSVASPKVSRRHARILVTEASAILEDLGSKNGTYVGDLRIQGPTELRHGDRIMIGPLVLIFRVSSAEEPTQSERS
jgi:DNA-binding winged helix-turn-helix (wHTH) protein